MFWLSLDHHFAPSEHVPCFEILHLIITVGRSANGEWMIILIVISL